ncbi:hypothetical protein JTB14_029415 [Gonioctena quinquepunctata]|nr:hypothetical protein JTB14_029415 [Gonioctena quinquepunctata]
MEASKVQIGLLEGKIKLVDLEIQALYSAERRERRIGSFRRQIASPLTISRKCVAGREIQYDKNLADFNQADSSALLILTVNMTKETLEKGMRFSTTRDMWLELHRLFDGNVENKTYDVCMQFFSYVKQADEDIATHTCKLKNLWNSLQKEISKDKVTYGRTIVTCLKFC